MNKCRFCGAEIDPYRQECWVCRQLHESLVELRARGKDVTDAIEITIKVSRDVYFDDLVSR